MANNLVIDNIDVTSDENSNQLSATIDGELISFKVPSEFVLHKSAEWFIGVGLLEAMATGRTIDVTEAVTVSKQLVTQLMELQAVFSNWNPRLTIVNINCRTSDQTKDFENIGSFFSAGVDSSHTLIRRMDDITHLVMLRVFDMGDEQEHWDSRVIAQAKFAAQLGKKLIPVDTNARDWSDGKKIAWNFMHGLLISSAGTALGMKRLYVPSSHPYSFLDPWGSHPLTDPMWTTESTTVIHDGASHTRVGKTREIAAVPQVANNLQVCWRGIHENCGQCPKCLRTMAALYLMKTEIDSLPTIEDINQLKRLRPSSDSTLSTVDDLIYFAKAQGNEAAAKILTRNRRIYLRGKILPLVDQVILRGAIRRLYRAIKKPRWIDLRVTLISPDRGDF
tara:strand:+ start:15248 stop:16423 length:1176 start_codon:yes stop_codon:yes gene_type:complete